MARLYRKTQKEEAMFVTDRQTDRVNNKQEAQLLLGDRATRKNAKDS